jgi:isocitrate dehydrogenase (NAD+)
VGNDIQGQNLANPTSMILSGVMMLRHLDLEHEANLISNAVLKVIADGKWKTTDMGGSLSTTAFTQAIVDNL